MTPAESKNVVMTQALCGCGSPTEEKRYLSFSYHWCPKCRDEAKPSLEKALKAGKRTMDSLTEAEKACCITLFGLGTRLLPASFSFLATRVFITTTGWFVECGGQRVMAEDLVEVTGDDFS